MRPGFQGSNINSGASHCLHYEDRRPHKRKQRESGQMVFLDRQVKGDFGGEQVQGTCPVEWEV